MKRSWPKLAEVLEDIELDRFESKVATLDAGEEEDLYFGHLRLAVGAGLVEGVGVEWKAKDWVWSAEKPLLTMKGHDVLEAIRTKTVWTRIKEQSVEHAVPITVEFIKHVIDIGF